jgi:hypothetical protein
MAIFPKKNFQFIRHTFAVLPNAYHMNFPSDITTIGIISLVWLNVLNTGKSLTNVNWTPGSRTNFRLSAMRHSKESWLQGYTAYNALCQVLTTLHSAQLSFFYNNFNHDSVFHCRVNAALGIMIRSLDSLLCTRGLMIGGSDK